MSARSLPWPLLVVTDRHGSERPLADTVTACLTGGARWIWFRDRDMAEAERRRLGARLRDLTRSAGAVLTVGGDVDLAAELEADGVHLSGARLDRIGAARARLGPGALIGLSAHSVAEVARAGAEGADYATLSPIFASASKPGYGPALGPDTIRAAAGTGLPVVALGGVSAEQAAECRSAGATTLAVMGGPMRAADPEAEIRRLLKAWRDAA
ncbi:thiamine phosphate synthase [Methylobacterium radiodurans]|uniref:Thiamine-phosphate synthase n=1 Tax=Methylobacterium radiodurans TaxID=2202828 RepID=A0A2U8VS23_9HYPH|nr:thiamine phosphate synthase [Methylobacterium radiodurans]AWN36082.1 thiamine phosphate synthase [Methylobacterium radiodurans]